MRQRLQKILAQAGRGSRRASEQLITSGCVSVNGERVTELGAQADPETDVIEVDGEPIRIPATHIYLAMNKPWGFLTTARDPRGRRTVVDLLPPELPSNVLPVGRLDRDTEGLLLFTSDGELAHRLAHPRFTIDKEYYALVRGGPDTRALGTLRAGVDIDGRKTSPAEAEVAPPPYGYGVRKDHTWLRIVVHEGRKRQVRRMCAQVGHPVRNLVRTRIGDVLLGRLATGKTRALTERELEGLRRSVGLAG